MINYEANIQLTDAEGGSWGEVITFQAPDDEAAEDHVCEEAEAWFSDGEEIGSGKIVVSGAVEASIELRDLDAGEDVLSLTVTPDHHNGSGVIYRRILSDRAGTTAALYCSTSDWAFGLVFTQDDERSADERAEAFLRWLSTNKHAYEMHPIASGRDARSLTDAGLEKAYSCWLAQEAAQFEREDVCERADPCTPSTVNMCESCERRFQRERTSAL